MDEHVNAENEALRQKLIKLMTMLLDRWNLENKKTYYALYKIKINGKDDEEIIRRFSSVQERNEYMIHYFLRHKERKDGSAEVFARKTAEDRLKEHSVTDSFFYEALAALSPGWRETDEYISLVEDGVIRSYIDSFGWLIELK